MQDVFLCHPRSNALGRFGDTLSSLRHNDLATTIFNAVLAQASDIDPATIEEVFMDCVNHASEDNRNVARMSALMVSLPTSVSGTILNQLYGSGMVAVVSMPRAPYVMCEVESAFSRGQAIDDTTIGCHFVNPLRKKAYDFHSMPEIVEKVAEQPHVARENQDSFALRSHKKAAAQQAGRLKEEITPIEIPRCKQEPLFFVQDEYLRKTCLKKLVKLPTPFREEAAMPRVATTALRPCWWQAPLRWSSTA